MQRPQDTSVLMHRRFEDFDELAVAARHWDLDLMQLDGGEFEGEAVQAVSGSVLFSEGRFGRTLKQQGSAPKAMRTFVVPAGRDVHFKWRRKDIGPDDLLLFPPSGDLHSISQPTFHVFTVSLPESLLDETAEVAGTPKLPEMLRREKMPSPSPLMDLLRERLRGISLAAREDVGRPDRSAVLNALQFEIPLLLVKAMAAARTSAEDLAARKRDRAIRQAEAYIAEFQDHPITVRDLCLAAKVSERTLEYAFLEQFGVTPRTYLKAVRLNGVRRELKRADPLATKIYEIAAHWGFWHMGQFAADYRKQFSELPSQTLSTVAG